MGALMLMKGPEVAAHYPVPSDRPFRDLDLMVEDPIAAQNAFIAVGFVEYGEPAAYTGLQHLPPLIRPGAPLVVEVHRRPSQPFWLPPVSPDSIFRTAVPAATGVPGILAPQPSAHAVFVVAHAWNHEPLGSMGSPIGRDGAPRVCRSPTRRRLRTGVGLGGNVEYHPRRHGCCRRRESPKPCAPRLPPAMRVGRRGSHRS